MNDTLSPYPALSQQQQARAEALMAARSALVARSGGFGTSSSAPDCADLLALARYIETGEDPYASGDGEVA